MIIWGPVENYVAVGDGKFLSLARANAGTSLRVPCGSALVFSKFLISFLCQCACSNIVHIPLMKSAYCTNLQHLKAVRFYRGYKPLRFPSTNLHCTSHEIACRGHKRV
jgi:hypothetical protein